MYIEDSVRIKNKEYIGYPIDNIIFNIGEKTLLSIGYKICSIYSYVNSRHMSVINICSNINMSNIHICKYIHMYNMYICRISSYENRCIFYTLEGENVVLAPEGKFILNFPLEGKILFPLERKIKGVFMLSKHKNLEFFMLSLERVSPLLKGIHKHIYSGTIIFINPIPHTRGYKKNARGEKFSPSLERAKTR